MGVEKDIRYCNYVKQEKEGKIYCHKCAINISCGGENNYRWKSDKTQEERKIERAYPEYRDFVKKVLARDNYTCKCCGADRSGDLIVHHLDGYNWCKEKRTDETNGITLCGNCHSNFHLKYGTGNNTKEQFYEWFGQAVELVKYNDELPSARKIYCIEEDKIYDSALELSKEWGCTRTQIYNVCNHKQKCNTLFKKHIMYYSEYKNMSKEEIELFLKQHPHGNVAQQRQVICITTGKIFNTIVEAGKYYNMPIKNDIYRCCQGERKVCGRLEDGTKLQWMYLEDYKLLKSKKALE